MNGMFLQEGAGFWLEGRANKVYESALVLNNLAIDAGIYGKQYRNMRSIFFSLLIFLGLTKQKSRAINWQ